jgi:DNA-binding MarR family transcriptional regulator
MGASGILDISLLILYQQTDMADGRAKEVASNYPVAALLKRGIQLLRDSFDEALRPYGVTSAQIHLLSALERDPGISGAKLARTCLITPQTAQVSLRGIEAKGWILRRADPENERILLARLTPSGKRTLTRGHVVLGRIYSQMLSALTREEAGTLESLLSRCVASLELPPLPASKPPRSRPAADAPTPDRRGSASEIR